ncbi:MAG TPA: nucleotide exchange factor GrpE [Candidatus Amulumruptor caecigallinarius]|uniref:Protein GrpE n=1 Tax=Candidatus Amulumruptor caecigallinarius TaxID=2109911 RepID=A0A921JH57_9BACT|nr:nucleotide exchange factor GrpE [Candidatus Amulumruptor caecigallinarius]
MSADHDKKENRPSDVEQPEIMDDLQQADGQEISEEANAELNAELTEVEILQKKYDETAAALEKEKNEYLFLMAEFDNFRKRNVKERGELIKNASESVMKQLLPIVDDMERGLEATKDAEDPNAIREGMQLIYNKLVKMLEHNGVKAIESTGADFNPELHDAIAMVPVDDESLKGKVIDTPTKGYMINDKVLRHAKVAVGQ